MARTASQYKRLLQALLPSGKLWSRRDDSMLSKILFGIANEFSRIEERAENLIKEKDTRTSVELLEEHELDYGLPEIGESIAESNEDRQEETHAALLRVGQQFSQYFIDIAEAFGYTITVEEYTPFLVGVNKVGDPVGGLSNLFYFKILIDLDSVTYSKEFNLTKLISRMKAIKPAHTHILFGYTGAGFSRGFSRGFDSIPYYDNSWANPSFDSGFSSGYENNTDYDGVNYVGGFNSGFSIDFDSHHGGGFTDGFTVAFARPS